MTLPGILALALLTQSPSPPRSTPPVLAFPESGLDDAAAYQGYQTRFYRDAKSNAVQVYLDARSGRVVQVWADAANESIGFTARAASDHPARLSWAADDAQVSDSGRARTIEYHLASATPHLALGWFIIGSMRVERDFQYARAHLRPFSAPPFRVAEESALVAGVEQLPPDEQARHLMILGARDLTELRARLDPSITVSRTDTSWRVRIAHTALDGQTHLDLELTGDPRRVAMRSAGRAIELDARPGQALRFAVRATTDAAALTPLARNAIFTPEFLAFLEGARGSGSDARYRRMEREARSVELLSSSEKLLAGMPNYATYFGRDMMMTALMMRPIWTASMSEHVIASVLRKLSPTGHVSHEEALGGQAIRENGAAYGALVAQYLRLKTSDPRLADSVLSLAHDRLAALGQTRENYHMMDGEFQLPVLVARYLADTSVTAERKRAFLLERGTDKPPRVALLLRELGYVAELTSPYAQSPIAANLVSFPKGEKEGSTCRSASWRDSNAGYGGGCFAMDINAIWVPEALRSMAEILGALRALGAPGLDSTTGALGSYARDASALHRAGDVWTGAWRHFMVRLSPAEVRARVESKLAWMPRGEQAYWRRAIAATGAARDSLAFLALSLDDGGRPIPVVNTDPATGLFLQSGRAATDSSLDVAAIVASFVRPYPVGLLIDRVGPAVSNDAFASPTVWESFRADTYHSPRVVWGREVNLLLLGLGGRIASAATPGAEAAALDAALRRTRRTVEQSGFAHSELWSYRIEGGRLRPVRYGISSDLQLWSTADLAVQYVMSRLPRR